MTNVGEELREHFEELKEDYPSLTVRCVHLYYCGYPLDPDKEPKYPFLKEGEDLELFLKKCDEFEYDSGYHNQNLEGTIWYTDGTYSNRYEYDGSECWEYQIVPEIPPHLLNEHKQTGQDTTSLQVKREDLN